MFYALFVGGPLDGQEIALERWTNYRALDSSRAEEGVFREVLYRKFTYATEDGYRSFMGLFGMSDERASAALADLLVRGWVERRKWLHA
jgi:hypothetical protein